MKIAIKFSDGSIKITCEYKDTQLQVGLRLDEFNELCIRVRVTLSFGEYLPRKAVRYDHRSNGDDINCI